MSNMPSQQQQQQVVIVNNPHQSVAQKSVFVAFLLTFLFGPLGMLYTTVPGALVMLVLSVLVAIFTLGVGLLITWPICIIWACVAASK